MGSGESTPETKEKTPAWREDEELGWGLLNLVLRLVQVEMGRGQCVSQRRERTVSSAKNSVSEPGAHWCRERGVPLRGVAHPGASPSCRVSPTLGESVAEVDLRGQGNVTNPGERSTGPAASAPTSPHLGGWS